MSEEREKNAASEEEMGEIKDLPAQVKVESDHLRDVNIILPSQEDDMFMLGDTDFEEEEDVAAPPIPAEAMEMEAPPPVPEQGWEPEESEPQAVLEMEAEAMEVPPPFPAGDLAAASEKGMTWVEDREFYRKEAEALAQLQPDRAALMWMEAATVAASSGAPENQIMDDLEAALALRPDAAWLLARGRRLAMQLSNYERALKMGQRQVKIGGDNMAGAAVLIEAAAVVRYHLSDPKTALRMVEQALQLHGGSVPGLVRAVALRGECQLHAEAAEGLELLSDHLTNPQQRSLCLYTAGTIRETRMQDPRAAQATYLRATEADPQNIPAVLAMSELYADTKQWLQYCRSLEHLADLFEDPATQSRLLHQAGALHLDLTGDLDGASRDLSRAARLIPEDNVVLQKLVFTYKAKDCPRETIQALRQLIELTLDRQGRASMLTQMGILYARLHEEDQAMGAFREALEQVPGYLPALQELSMLYRQRGDFSSLVAIGTPETEGMLPPLARAVRHVELAELLDKDLGRPEEAVAAYRRALELMPGFHLGYWGLTTLLRRLEWHEDLAQVLAQQAENSKDPKTKNHLYLELARLHAGPLGSPEQAIETLLEGKQEESTNSIMFELINLYARTERHVDLVSQLLQQAEQTSDPEEASGRRLQAAMVLEKKLQEYDRALRIYKEEVERDPHNHAAIHGTGRILHRLGNWNDLVKLHHHELTTEPDRPDAAILLCRVGRIIDEKLGNASAAVGAYAKALRRDPTNLPALVAFDGLVRAEKQWQKLVETLQKYAEVADSGRAGALALCRAGEVACWMTEELGQAALLYEQALERDPNLDLAWNGLLRVRLRQQNWRAAVGVLDQVMSETQPPAERCALQLQKARLQEFRLDETPDLNLYEQAASGPFGDRLREEVMRVQRFMFQGTDDEPTIADRLEELGSRTADDALAAAYLLEACHIREFGRFVEKEPSSLEMARQAFQRKPEDLNTIWSLERGLLRANQWKELAELYEREAQYTLDRTVRVQRLAAAGEAYWMFDATEDAERVCRECLNFDAHCLPALKLLARSMRQREDWQSLAELLDRLAEACRDSNNRLTYCLEAADIWSEQVADPKRALASLTVALADNPTQPVAFERAEEILRARADFEEISRLYQRCIRAIREDQAKVDLLRRHARLLRDDLDQPDRAISEFNTLFMIAPNDLSALQELAELHAKQKHWSDAASALGILIERADDPDVRHSARLKQGELWLNQLHEPKRAREVLEQAAAERSDDVQLKKLMVNLAMTVGNWQDAREQLEQLSAQADQSIRVWSRLQLAEVARLGLHDTKLADQCIQEAMLEGAKDTEALDALRRHYHTPEEKQRMVDVAEQLLSGQLASDRQLSESEVAALRELIVRVLVEDLDQAARAMPHLHQLEREQPGLASSAILLAKMMEQQGNVAEALRRYQGMIEQDAGGIDAYRGLVRCGDPEVAESAATLVELMGDVGDEEQQRLDSMVQQAVPRGRFSPQELQVGRGYRPLEELFQILEPYLGEIYPTFKNPPLEWSHQAVTAAEPLARTLGIERIDLSLGEGEGAKCFVGQPPHIQIAPSLAEHPEQPAFRFWIGRALVYGMRGAAVMQQLEERDITQLVDALYARHVVTDEAQQLKKQLLRLIPRKVRKQLEQVVLPDDTARLISGYRIALDGLADGLALVLSRHPGAALKDLARVLELDPQKLSEHTRIASLMRFAVSDDYARLFRSIWH